MHCIQLCHRHHPSRIEIPRQTFAIAQRALQLIAEITKLVFQKLFVALVASRESSTPRPLPLSISKLNQRICSGGSSKKA